MQVTANGDVGFSLPPVSSSENIVNRRFWTQEDTVNGRRQLPVCPTDIAETASDTGDRAKIDDIDRWKPVCTAAGRTVTASDDDVKARSSLTDVNSSGIPSSVRNSDVFTSNSKERRGWTTELLTRTMASDKDEAARRTQQQRRMPATGAIIKTDDVVPAAAAVAAVDDSHRTSSFSTTNPIIVQSKKVTELTHSEGRQTIRITVILHSVFTFTIKRLKGSVYVTFVVVMTSGALHSLIIRKFK
jgi:hypothetical protein